MRKALGIAQAGSNYNFLTADEIQRLPRGISSGKGLGTAQLLSESGLYKFTLRSTKPEAKAFQEWITRVVLPALRKDGAYVVGEEKVVTGEMDEDELVLKAMGIMQRKLGRLTQDKAALQAEDARMLPAAEVGAAVGQRTRLGVVEFVRKLPGVNTQKVQGDLHAMQYLYKCDGHWAVYAKFKGVLFDEVMAPEGRSKIVVLEQGQQFLVNLYHEQRRSSPNSGVGLNDRRIGVAERPGGHRGRNGARGVDCPHQGWPASCSP